jgi:nucleoside-diphosphate-sugar epimerase
MTGTSAEYGPVRGPASESLPCRPVSSYGACKHAAVTLVTSMAREQQRPTVVLRPYGLYGPGDDPTHVLPHVIAGMLNGERVRLTGAEQVRSFLYVDDLVAVLLRLAGVTTQTPGSIYNIGSDQGLSIRELVARAAAVVGRAGDVEFGAIEYDANELFELVPDISSARRDLDFAPATSLDEGLRRTAEWIRRSREEPPG